MNIHIHTIILGALAAASTSGCSTLGCRSDSEDFALDEVITEGDVREILTYQGYSERSDIGCETFCAFKYDQQSGWESASPTSCSFALDDAPGTNTEDAVGDVQCEGTGYEYLCEGRRPLGHVEPPAALAGASTGTYLAACAHLESASIEAFHQLARQLSAWGAPPALVARCTAAAAEEAAHAQTIGDLARRHGAAALLTPSAAPAAADRLTVALHNAVEGCVQEAWAALMAHWKAARADDEAVRAAYRHIAAEEAGHAQLAWDIHRWLLETLPPAARQQVVAAQQAALARLPAQATAQLAALPPALGRPAVSEVQTAAAVFCSALAAA